MVQVHGEIRRSRELSIGNQESQISRHGVLAGKMISVQEDATSLIADAAEELTFEASETVEKKVEERHVEKERPSELVHRIRKLQQMVPDFDEQQFLRLLEKLKKHQPHSSQNLLDSARAAFPDVSQQHLALQLLEEIFQDSPELHALTQAAMAELDAEAAPAIRAGINTSTVAHEYAQQGLGELSELRNFYRTTVLQYEGVTATFHAITQQFPGQSIPNAIRYLLRAVGNDLQARGPSLAPEELRMILNDLYYLEYLGHLHNCCNQLLQRTMTGFGERLMQTPQELMSEFLTLKDKPWITESDVLNLAQRAGITDSSARIYFLQGFLNMVRQAPLKLFTNDDSRLTLIAKVQEALDRSIEEEA